MVRLGDDLWYISTYVQHVKTGGTENVKLVIHVLREKLEEVYVDVVVMGNHPDLKFGNRPIN